MAICFAGTRHLTEIAKIRDKPGNHCEMDISFFGMMRALYRNEIKQNGTVNI